LSMQLREGDHLSVLGESGCGKSTLLKLIYGMLAPDAGKILFKGQEIPGPSRSLLPGTPDIKYLAQDFGLMPYATVSENVGRDLTNTNKPEKHRRVQQMLDLV